MRDRPVRIAIIGAGSVVFTRNLVNDVLLTPALQDGELVLMDIDDGRLQQALGMVRALIARRGVAAQVTATPEMRLAVSGADYVLTTFQQGGLDAYKLDIEIPAKYGVGQCVGDTLGPGGVFRALRTIPVLAQLGRDLDEVAPQALLLNYVNPMAANCWAYERITGRPFVGLCHSVQDTSRMLARWLGTPYEELEYLCAGINHQAFFLSLRRGREDLYPALRQAIARKDLQGLEPVRIDLMRHFGYFVTESSGHASEYVPYYRKNERMIEEELVPQFKDEKQSGWFDYGRTGGNLRNALYWADHAAEAFAEFAAPDAPLPEERSDEYGSTIMEAIESNEPAVIYGNVPNRGFIDALPAGCCVEVPCLIDANGVQPVRIEAYPPQLAALNRTNINVQELIVEAAVSGRTDAIYHAVMLDPLTAAVCTLAQIHDMVAELLTAEAQWLPF